MKKLHFITILPFLIISALLSNSGSEPCYTMNPVTDSLFGNDMNNPRYINGWFYIESRDGEYPHYRYSYFRSKKGVVWEPVDTVPGSGIQWPSDYGRLGVVHNRYLGATETDSAEIKNTVIYSSENGMHWEFDTIPEALSIYSVTYGNKNYVMVGFDGAILLSNNGSSWKRGTFPTQSELRSVHFVDGRFIVTAVDLSATNFDENGEPLGHHFIVTTFTSQEGSNWSDDPDSLPPQSLKEYLQSVASGSDSLYQDKLEWILKIENSTLSDHKAAFGNRTIIVTNRSNSVDVYHY